MPTLREIRVEKGWSQVTLAEKAEIGVITVIRMENGKAIVPKSLNAICKALGVTPQSATEVKVTNPLGRSGKRA